MITCRIGGTSVSDSVGLMIMSKIYELFDRPTANLIGTYDSVDEALEVVRRAVEQESPASFRNVALGAEDEHDDTTVIAAGDELVALALGSAAKRGAR
jgi:hypothetical protein